MEEGKNRLTVNGNTKDKLTYIQYKKKKQAALLDANEELKNLVSAQRANKGESEEDEREAEKKIREYLKTHNEGKENNEYLVRGAELQCSCGSHTRKLNLNTCHGVYMKGHPVVHELDCASGDGKNITWFGVCDHEDFESEQIMVINQDGSKKCGLKCNPKLIGVWMDSYEETKIVDNCYEIYVKRFGPDYKFPHLDGPVVLKNAEESEERHIPQLNLSHDLIQIDRLKGNWSMDYGDDTEDTLEGYACNVLTVGSFLVCQRGGIISPVNSGQDRTVKLEEFVEGWNAYRRVMGFKSSEKNTLSDEEQSISLLPERTEPNVSNSIIDRIGKKIVHTASNKQVLDFLDSLTKVHIPQSTINNNYNNNIIVLTEGGTSSDSENKNPIYTPGKHIENQKEWENVYFGNSKMSDVGCEIMATHNALTSLGEHRTVEDMADLISEYEKEGAVRQGKWGVAPTAIYSYFSDKGYDVDMTDSLLMEDINSFGEEYDTVIITFFNNQDNVMGQIHTINVSKEDGKYFSHNANWKDAKNNYVQSNPYDSLWDVVIDVSGRDAKPISVIGINQKVENE